MRCTKKDFGRYNVTEPPVEHLRDPLYKTEREIMKVYMLIILSALFSFSPPLIFYYASFCQKPKVDLANVLCNLVPKFSAYYSCEVDLVKFLIKHSAEVLFLMYQFIFRIYSY